MSSNIKKSKKTEMKETRKTSLDLKILYIVFCSLSKSDRADFRYGNNTFYSCSVASGPNSKPDVGCCLDHETQHMQQLPTGLSLVSCIEYD